MRVRPYPPIESIVLAWYCDGCGLPVENGAGWIEVSYRDLTQAQDRAARVRANFRAKDNCGTPITPADLSDLPDPVRWMAWHQRCTPDTSDSPSYRMPIGRVRNLSQLLELHGEVSRKTWHLLTDFVDLRLFLQPEHPTPTPTSAAPNYAIPLGPVSVSVNVS